MQDINTGTEPYPEDQTPKPRGRRWRDQAWIWVTLALISGFIIFAIARSSTHKIASNVPVLPPPGTANSVAAPSPVELSVSFREIAKAIKPAVVNINVVETVSRESGLPDLFNFGSPDQNTPRRRPGTGSGFIVTPDGYILTNDHVVGHADRIEVTTADGRTIRAKLVGTDPETDIAVIKIEGDGLPTTTLGDSDEVEQGDWVLALGSPFGLAQTLTAGIVSATGRELNTRGSQYSRFIQTDASINPGNSGGPLVSMQGEVIGINTLIFSQTGSSVGIGFAIASNVVRNVFNKLVKNGKVTRGYLGVIIRPLDEATAHALNLEPNSGVLIDRLSDPQSPAGHAGLQSGDVILAFNGKKVRTPRELMEVVAETSVGESAQVDYVRNGQPLSAKVEVTERPADVNTARNDSESQGDEAHPQSTRLGITAETVTPEMAEQMKLSVPHGAMVQSVAPGSPASEAGIRHGDVIHRIDTVEVTSVENLVEAINSIKTNQVALQIERGGQMTFITVTFD